MDLWGTGHHCGHHAAMAASSSSSEALAAVSLEVSLVKRVSGAVSDGHN